MAAKVIEFPRQRAVAGRRRARCAPLRPAAVFASPADVASGVPFRATSAVPYKIKTIRTSLLARELVAVVSSPTAAENALRPIFEQLDGDREHFVLLALNAQNCAIGYKVVATGGMSASFVDPKTLFRDALLLGAAAVVLAHNHPSGDPTPSPEDIALTRRLASAGELLDIRIHDHIVLGNGCVSLAERGLMVAK